MNDPKGGMAKVPQNVFLVLFTELFILTFINVLQNYVN